MFKHEKIYVLQTRMFVKNSFQEHQAHSKLYKLDSQQLNIKCMRKSSIYFWKISKLQILFSETVPQRNVTMVAMKENSGRQTQFVEKSHRGGDILNFITTDKII